MTADELPPDPLPELGKPHCLAVFKREGPGKILVGCVDCHGDIVGEAKCAHEALVVILEHAQTMGVE